MMRWIDRIQLRSTFGYHLLIKSLLAYSLVNTACIYIPQKVIIPNLVAAAVAFVLFIVANVLKGQPAVFSAAYFLANISVVIVSAVLLLTLNSNLFSMLLAMTFAFIIDFIYSAISIYELLFQKQKEEGSHV